MRRFASSACFTFGSVWAAAGILKLLFGVRLTLPLLPPLGLGQVAVIPSLITGLVLFSIGAVLGRGANASDGLTLNDVSLEPETLLGEGATPATTPVRPSARHERVPR
jgi:hypothetical protein